MPVPRGQFFIFRPTVHFMLFCALATHPPHPDLCGFRRFQMANANAKVLAEQRRAERDRRRRIVAGLPKGAGATATFLSQAARILNLLSPI